MATAWHYQVMGESHGPVTSARLRALASSGEVTPDSLVRRDGHENWVIASHVKDLFPKEPQPEAAPTTPIKSAPPILPATQKPSPEFNAPATPAVNASASGSEEENPSESDRGIGLSQSQGNLLAGLLIALIGIQILTGIILPQVTKKSVIAESSTTTWEYKIASPGDTTFQFEMDNMGSDGWELVSARRASSEFGGVKYEMIFKRPKKYP